MKLTLGINNINQLQYESDCWKRMLEFITGENAYAKNRLAEVIKANPGEVRFLELAEFYQNYFIQQETLLSLLRNDLYMFDRLMHRSKLESGVLNKELITNRKRLKIEFDKLVEEFSRARKQFNNFLEANA